ncbi:TonB-dependent receptor [Chitinophaga sp. MD30]|nr:TonB-dependent receptor [Chitinophaga sp. MD30]
MIKACHLLGDKERFRKCMKLYILLLVSCITNCLFAQAQQPTAVLRGRVFTAGNTPAAGVTVHVSGIAKGASTDEEGRYRFKAPAGKQTLIVRAVGQQEQRIPVVLTAGDTTDVPQTHLTVAQYHLDDVVVTGQFEPQSMRNAVQRVRTISNERIKLRGGTDIIGVINNELGVRLSNDLALGETRIELMGMGGANVKILLDGVPVVDRGDIKQSLGQIDINTVERIEIIEGPMSVVYGTDGLAGVINIITRKSSGEDRLSVSARVQEETVGNEYNAFTKKGVHNENLQVNWERKGWYAGAGVTRNNFGGWQGGNSGRKKEWSPKDQWLGNVSFGYGKKNWKAWYRLDYLNEDIWSGGNINPANGKTTDQHYITNRYTHQGQAEYKLNDAWSFNGIVSYQDYKRRTKSDIINFVDGTSQPDPQPGAQALSTFNTWFFRGTAQYRFSSAVSFQPGIEYKRDAAGGERIEGTPVIADYAFFISSEIKPLSILNIRPGLRFSKNSAYDAPPVIPSLNARLAITKDIDLRLGYARGFRAPALRELYFYFFDASHSIKGNPNLKAEHSNSFTGSLTWRPVHQERTRLSITLSGFYNNFDNLIATAKSAEDPRIFTYINVNKFKTTGGMLEGTLNWNNLQLSAGFSYIGRYNEFFKDTTQVEKGRSLPQFVWSAEINTGATWKFPKLGGTLSAFYKFTGKRPEYVLASTTPNGPAAVLLSEVQAFHWMDLTATKKINKLVTLNLGVKNLFDINTLRNTVMDNRGGHNTNGPVPLAYGRSYFLGLNFSWNR